MKTFTSYPIRISSYFRHLSIAIVFLFVAVIANAQVTLSLSSKEANNKTSILSGEKYTVQLNYSFSSTTGSTDGAKIVVNLPDNIYDIRNFIGSVHAPGANFVFTNTPGAKKLTITFVNPLASGSSGTLSFDVVSNNVTTADNTVLTTVSEFTSNGGFTSGPQTQSITVHASPKICAKKTLLSGGAVGSDMVYRIALTYDGSNPYNAPVGTLGLTNLQITDMLPAGAEFVSGKMYASSGEFVNDGTYTNGSVVFNVPNMDWSYDAGGLQWRYKSYIADITVKYNQPAFNANDIVTNMANVKYTVPQANITDAVLTDGQTVGTCTADLKEVTTLVPPQPNGSLKKILNGSSNSYPGNLIVYSLEFTNTGNIPLENVEIIEDIPSNLRVNTSSNNNYTIRIDHWSEFMDHGEYQTNLSNGWIVLPATGGNNFPLSLSAGEYYTKLKFVLKTVAAGASIPGANLLYFVAANEVSAAETATNCMSWNSTTAGIPDAASRTSCAGTVTIQPRPTTSTINYNMWNTPGCSGGTTMSIGQTVQFKGEVSTDNGFSDAVDPICAFLIPSGYDYIAGSEAFNPGTSDFTVTPTLEIIPSFITYGGITYNLYRYTFPSGTVLPYGKAFYVYVDVKTTPRLTPGVAYDGAFIATAGNSSANNPPTPYGTTFTDANDWDLDVNKTEIFQPVYTDWTSCHLAVSPSASIESIKWVKGQLDEQYSRYPAVANTVPGGVADYRLVVKNTGNVSMKGITLIDIFPYVGDAGLIDPSPRLSEWSPNLASPIAAPAGVTVYYSTATNPCRDEIKQPGSPTPYPSGCTNPGWTTVPPSDLTKVASVKIDFGTTILTGGDSLVFSWPMRAPVNGPTNGEVAYNSFAFTATRADNNSTLLSAEPTKVGIKLKPGQPAYIGDLVWNDSNKDGIQDANEAGQDGIVVNLMVPRVPGQRNPDTDSLAAFTITADGGKYLFSQLSAGDYYLVFQVPNNKSVSPKNASGSYFTNDSDGDVTTYKGMNAATTTIIHLIESQEDLSWDLGLFNVPGNISLPVKGLSLQVTLQDNRSVIDWKILAENEVAWYEVERSANGKDFSVVSNKVAPRSNKNSAASYQSTDDLTNIANASVLYYRIKVTYVSGSVDYSDIRNVKLTNAQKPQVWPNPAKSNIQLQIPSATTAQATVKLSDIAGHNLATYNFNLSKGNNQFTITDLYKYNNGIYILDIRYNDTRSVIKIRKD